jgi:hypothetical protein
MALRSGYSIDEALQVARTIEAREADEQRDADLASEHAELLDWKADQIVQRIHFANSLHDLVVQVLAGAEQIGEPPTSLREPLPSTDDVPF